MSVKLKTTPGNVIIAADGSKYTADAAGIITNVSEEDLASLMHAGCENLVNDVRQNLNAAVDPAVTDDSASNYGVGSIWINTTGGAAFVCEDATASAAVWARIGGKTTPVNSTGTTLVVTAALHAGRTVTLNRATGIAVTLPAATGTGNVYDFTVNTAVSGGNHVLTAAGSDKMQGTAWVLSDNSAAVLAYDAAGTAAVITLDGSTKGGYVGHRITLKDVGAALWQVRSEGKATGTEATPFS